jgi:hypothetical protein
MDILYYLVVILAAYFFIVFVLLRLVVPFMGFGRLRLPKALPEEYKVAIADLEGKASSSEEYLRLAYDLVLSKWHAGRMDTIYHAPKAFRTDILKIWNQPGYAHCTTMNYVLFILLAGSKYFKPEDIQVKSVFFNMFIHQYLKVRIGDRWINADPGGAAIRGLPFGARARFFG